MSDKQRERLESLRAFIKAAEEGAVIPPVAEEDLKRLHDLGVETTKRCCGKDGVLSIESMARACDPEANLPAVWLRHTHLRSLTRKGLLEEWQHGTDLDEAVFRLAATIHISGMDLDGEAFVRQLREMTAAGSRR
ncbi:MAG TPA: hypothetical protein VMI10_12070 [Terriglobales bacterium]|nr:hypothetical protein [Terriglobales bacterium]